MIEITVKGENWADLVKSVEDLASGMTGGKVEADISTPPKKTAPKVEKATPKTEPVAEAVPEAKPTKLTLDDVKGAFGPVLLKKRDEAMAILKKYKATGISKLKEEDYADFIQEVKALA
ncbi:hypothetical protein [Xylocopilactobacillus apis]|uniref:rRNA biogenesis protein rrp5 n=1 Tax=Xylocopilactobacillus apis TaxID=2932183 RepID=A0AAU9D320_9LACO|nr:hypothetical protein [Xylocopilactobacillus apis]BDR56906.1 hypothetical protein KIMC2_14680 [Xylocopilactobacillus apis]